MVEIKPPYTSDGNEYQKKTNKHKGNSTKKKITNVRRLVPRPKVQNLKPRPTSRVVEET